MIWLYRVLFLPVLLLVLPYYLLRMWRRGGYRKDFQHRLGRFRRLPPKSPERTRLWIQAVSVGEVLAVGPLIDALGETKRYEIVLTTTTSTGYAEARKRYRDKVLATGIFPLDFWPASRLAWRRIDPDAILLTESELWPEHLHQSKRRGVPAFLINARISDRSFARYEKVPRLTQRLLRKFHAIFPSSETDARRLEQLGAPPHQLHRCGSIKLDVPPPAPLDEAGRTALLASLGFDQASDAPPPILLGASTWPGEEAALIRIFARLMAEGIDCRLLLVPRHAERGGEIARLLREQPHPWHQRSGGASPTQPIDIHLADTTGELSQLTQVADLCFIGKSLPPNIGGQSPVDGAGLGKPLLFGPQMSNFKDIAQALLTAGAAREVADEAALEAAIRELLTAPEARSAMGQAGTAWHAANRGSCQRIATIIDAHLQSRST